MGRNRRTWQDFLRERFEFRLLGVPRDVSGDGELGWHTREKFRGRRPEGVSVYWIEDSEVEGDSQSAKIRHPDGMCAGRQSTYESPQVRRCRVRRSLLVNSAVQIYIITCGKCARKGWAGEGCLHHTCESARSCLRPHEWRQSRQRMGTNASVSVGWDVLFV